MENNNNMGTSRRGKSKKKKNNRSIFQKILIVLLILIISVIPFGFTIYFKLLMTPLLIFDVIWFAGTLIGYIWLN